MVPDRLVRPAFLSAVEAALIDGRVVADRRPTEHVTWPHLIQCLRILAAAECQHRVQCRWKQPPRTAVTNQLPTRLVEIDHNRQRQQFAQGVELPKERVNFAPTARSSTAWQNA